MYDCHPPLRLESHGQLSTQPGREKGPLRGSRDAGWQKKKRIKQQGEKKGKTTRYDVLGREERYGVQDEASLVFAGLLTGLSTGEVYAREVYNSRMGSSIWSDLRIDLTGKFFSLQEGAIGAGDWGATAGALRSLSYGLWVALYCIPPCILHIFHHMYIACEGWRSFPASSSPASGTVSLAVMETSPGARVFSVDSM